MAFMSDFNVTNVMALLWDCCGIAVEVVWYTCVVAVVYKLGSESQLSPDCSS